MVGTSDCGLHARVRLSPESPNTLTMTSVDDHGERRTRAFALDDPSALLREAQEGGFWCHVAGTCHHMVTSSPHAKSVATLARDAGVLLDNHRTTLPVKKGLSSSAAVCVLVARAFSRAFDLDLTVREEMSAAYAGERTTPSRCGRMDQACAFGPGRPVLLTFDGDTLDVEPLDRVAADVHIVVADLEASKDTVVILRDLQTAFVAGAGNRPEPDPVGVRVRRLLGETNKKIVREATRRRWDGRTPTRRQRLMQPRERRVRRNSRRRRCERCSPTTTSEPHRWGGKAWVVRGTGRCSSCAMGRLGGRRARRRCGGNSGCAPCASSFAHERRRRVTEHPAFAPYPTIIPR